MKLHVIHALVCSAVYVDRDIAVASIHQPTVDKDTTNYIANTDQCLSGGMFPSPPWLYSPPIVQSRGLEGKLTKGHVVTHACTMPSGNNDGY